MDPQAPGKRAFDSSSLSSPYLLPLSHVPFASSSLPSSSLQSGFSEFVRVPRPSSSPPIEMYDHLIRAPSPLLRDSPSIDSPALTPTLLAQGYGLGHSSSISIGSFGLSGALNSSPVLPDELRPAKPDSGRDSQKTLPPIPAENTLDDRSSDYQDISSWRELSGDGEVDTQGADSREPVDDDVEDSQYAGDPNEICSGCSECSGEFDFSAVFSLNSGVRDGNPEGGDGESIKQHVSNPFQEVEQPNPAVTSSSVLFVGSEIVPAVAGRPRLPRSLPLGRTAFFSRFSTPKRINLDESEAFSVAHPTAKHYEGCILCTPHPSPRNSTASSGTGGSNLLLAPSKQFAGPPPTEPLPPLADQEIVTSPDIPSSATAVGTPPISVHSAEEEILGLYTKDNEAEASDQNFENSDASRHPLRKRQSGYFLPIVATTGASTKVYLKSDTYCDDINDLSSSENEWHDKSTKQPNFEPRGEKDSIHSVGVESNVSQFELIPKCQSARLTFADSHRASKQIRITTRGLDRYEPRKKSPNNIPLDILEDGSGPSRKRSSWAGMFGNERDRPNPTRLNSGGSSPKSLSRPLMGQRACPTSRRARGSPRGSIPHPGERRDTRFSGTDGSYELVDLGPTPNISNVTIETSNTLKYRSSLTTLFDAASKFRLKNLKLTKDFHLSPKQKWVSFGVLATLLILIAVLIVLFVGGPVIFRRSIEDTKFDIQSLELNNFTSQSVSIQMKMKVKLQDQSNLALGATVYHLGTNNSLSAGHIHYSIENMLSVLPSAPVFEPEAAQVLKRFPQDPVSHEMQNPRKMANLDSMFQPGILGTFEIEETMIRSGKGELAISGDVNLGVDGDLRLEDPRAWAGFLTALLYRERLEMRVSGIFLGKFLGVWRRVNVSKKLPMNGMNGFNGFQIKNHGAFNSPTGNFSAELTWYNPSEVSLTLPSIQFDILAGGHRIGNSSLTSMRIVPGNNTMTNFTGSLDPTIFRRNRTLLSKYLSGFIAQSNGEQFSLLQLQGVTASMNGRQIYWLSPTIERMTFEIPLTARDPHLPVPLQSLGESFKWDFTFAAGTSKTLELTNGTLSMTLSLPFESPMFPVTIEDIRWDLTISNHHGPFVRIVSKFGSSDNNITVLEPGSHSIRSELGNRTMVDVLERDIYNTYFTKDFVGSKVVELSINGNVTLDVTTPLGNATVNGLGVHNERWDIKGLGGLDSGGKSKAQILNPKIMEDKEWGVVLVMNNPSDMDLEFGATTFGMFLGDKKQCFGVLTVDKFNFIRGSSNFPSKVMMDTNRCFGDGFSEFLSKIIAGGTSNFTLKFTDGGHAYTNEPFVTGLRAQRFDAVLQSDTQKLFDAFEILIFQYSIKVVITVAASLPQRMTFNLVDIMILGLPVGGGINSTVKSTSPRATGQLTQVDLASKSTLAETVQGLSQYVGRDVKIDIKGNLGINWNGVETVIEYEQGEIPVKVRRISRYD